MNRIIVLLILIPTMAHAAYTEFFCNASGNQINAGRDHTNAEVTSSLYTSTSGNWSTTTHIFTPTDGSTPASSIQAGDYASVYINGATTAVCTVLITNVAAGVNGAITTSATVSGTAPTTNSGSRSITVGGGWRGPNSTASGPPFLTNLGANGVNANGDPVRVNMKNDVTYTPTTTQTVTASLTIQGYTSTPGDKGRATLDFGTSTSDWLSGNTNSRALDLIITGNAASGSGRAVNWTTGTVIRVTASGARGSGFRSGSNGTAFLNCEAHNCNRANTAGSGGFEVNTSQIFENCTAHDNAGSNNDGFAIQSSAGSPVLLNCISFNNGRYGFGTGATTGPFFMIQCDAYNNSGDGLHIGSTTGLTSDSQMKNCIFTKNSGWGINSDLTTGSWNGTINNNAFGSGTQQNSSGQTNNTSNCVIENSITITANESPFVDAPNGDFRVNQKDVNFAGTGIYEITQGGYSGGANTVGFPDVGAVQSKTGSGGTFSKEVSYGYAY